MKIIEGIVTKLNGCNAKVQYVINYFNKKYEKRLSKSHFLIAHSELSLKIGDAVVLQSCAPISKTKKYRVISKKEALWLLKKRWLELLIILAPN